MSSGAGRRTRRVQGDPVAHRAQVASTNQEEGRTMSHSRRLRAASLFVAFAAQGLAIAPAQGQEPSEAQRAAYRRPATIPFPADNPYTPEKAALGKMLFFDTRLSRDKNLSCASCHNPSFGWEVPFATAIGAGGKPLGPPRADHAEPGLEQEPVLGRPRAHAGGPGPAARSRPRSRWTCRWPPRVDAPEGGARLHAGVRQRLPEGRPDRETRC